MEWADYKASLCDGCGHPKHETFAPENDDKYTATVLVCHACAARDRKSHVLSQTASSDAPPAGVMIAVQHDDELG